eukprot:5487385-Amphidinium_carterae.1
MACTTSCVPWHLHLRALTDKEAIRMPSALDALLVTRATLAEQLASHFRSTTANYIMYIYFDTQQCKSSQMKAQKASWR